MISKLLEFVKKHQSDIVLFVGVVLIALLSFAAGNITAGQQAKEPIQFRQFDYE